jgi:hypothetical protein
MPKGLALDKQLMLAGVDEGPIRDPALHKRLSLSPSRIKRVCPPCPLKNIFTALRATTATGLTTSTPL